ncbi:hypothetical protein Btru_004432 [Bulinus truncatus]|nr:hypothetical protein Btru_004432 [Bulinus truncatus]
MSFLNLLSSIRKQLTVGPNLNVPKESETKVGSSNEDSGEKNSVDVDEGYLLVNEMLDTELLLMNERSVLPTESSHSSAQVDECRSSNEISSSQRSAISDVPFHLHHSLVTQQQVSRIFSDLDLQRKQFDFARYAVDFSNEESVISGYMLKEKSPSG